MTHSIIRCLHYVCPAFLGTFLMFHFCGGHLRILKSFQDLPVCVCLPLCPPPLLSNIVLGSVIGWRIYPGTDQYRCQSPSTIFNCTFSSDILAVHWYIRPVNGTHWEKVEDLNGHMHTVSRANMQNWAALTVNDSGVLPSKIRYRCTVVLNNGSTDDSDPITLPPSEGQL